MRLFTAVELDPAVADAVGRASAALARRVREEAPAARVTWVAGDRLHLTLRFIGEVDEGQAARIRAALAAPIATDPFSIVVRGAGAFPSAGAPRVLWAGVEDAAAGLVALEREVTARLAACGIPPEERPFRPHLTLARVRDAAGLRARRVLEPLQEALFGTSRVEAITLFESRLSPRGPSYVALQRTRLGP